MALHTRAVGLPSDGDKDKCVWEWFSSLYVNSYMMLSLWKLSSQTNSHDVQPLPPENTLSEIKLQLTAFKFLSHLKTLTYTKLNALN